MVASAQHREVRERGGTALGPVADVMALAERHSAAWKATAVVAMVERTPYRGWNRPGSRADFDDASVRVMAHHDAARVAREAAGRFRGNVRAALEDRLAGRVGI